MPFIICLLAIFLQQTMVALTTLSIAQAAATVSAGNNPLPQLIVFCALLLTVNLPEIIIDLEREHTKYWLLARIVEKSSGSNYGATSSFFNKRIRSEKEPYIDTELWITISDDVSYATDALAALLNIVLNTLAIASCLDVSFVVALAISSCISLIFSITSFSHIKKRASRSQSARARLFASLRLCIPNVWIGNALNFKDWNAHLRQAEREALHMQSCLSLVRNGLSSFSVLASTVPFIVVVASYSLANLNNPENLSMLIAVLPRQVSLLQNIGTIVTYAAQLSERIARTKLVYSNLMLTEAERNTRGVIKWDELKLSSESMPNQRILHGIEDLGAAAHGFAPGRITLRGTNGCGKSTLLAQIKEQLGDSAFLLPANPALYFPQLDGREASSGQAVSRALELIESDYLDDTVTTVLLDEWDANLDNHMRAYHDRRLSGLAQRKCIIEVLHNKHQGE